MKRPILFSFLAVIVFSFFGVGYIYFHQEAMLFQNKTLPEDHIFTYEEPFTELFLDTDNNAQINALYFQVEQPKGVVLYFHGRGRNLSNIGKLSHEFTGRGYNLFIIDYRGFGKSKGKLSEAAIYHDADYCYDYLLNYFSEDQIILYGCSLGSGVATYVASHQNPRDLILEAPYFSILDLTPREVPYIPRFLIPLLLKYHFRTDQLITNVDSPIHIIHGTDDKLIPYDSSTRLIKLIEEKPDASLISIKHGEHYRLNHHSEYQQMMDQILN